MGLHRRDFLKWSSAAGAAGFASFGFDLAPAFAQASGLKISRATEVRSVCPYCAVGCSMIAYVTGHESFNTQSTLVHIEGDPDSPINGGKLCPKGSASKQLVTGAHRLEKVRYRRPGGTEWEELDLEVAMDMIADRVVAARAATWQQADEHGVPLRRTTGIASLGGATLDNEENYLIKKLWTALGAIQIENQARI
jgi:formate dehydrogenase major subunit